MPHSSLRTLFLAPRVAMLASATSLLMASAAQPQARGPSHQQIQETGAPIISAQTRREQEWLDARILQEKERQREERERLALADPEYRSLRYAGLNEFLSLMPGSYRIQSRVEQHTSVSAPIVQYNSDETGAVPVVIQGPAASTTRRWAVAGMAECLPVELDADLRCQFDRNVLPIATSQGRPSSKEQSESARHSVLWIALDRERLTLQTRLLVDGGWTQAFTGRIEEDVVRSKPSGPCLQGTCYRSMEVSVPPDAERISILLKSTGVTVTITMDRVSPPVRDNVLRSDSPLSPCADASATRRSVAVRECRWGPQSP